ncbi:MAG: ATP-binding protein [Chloroflexi bacterium]|nr:ATP-binding protein [Chloroflexota bacterium]
MADRRVQRKPLRVNNRAILQDARLAMGNDLMNALVELITNADDSYTRLGSPGVSEIRVEVNRRQRYIRVDDDAEGMTVDQLEERLGGLGERTSGIVDNERVRGFFGRGAKDVAALGDVTWITTRGGQQSQLTLSLSSDEDDAVAIADPIPDPSGRHGTTVQLQLREGVRIPRHEHLTKLLSRHFALVPILNDPMRKLVLIGGEEPEAIEYTMPEGVKWLDKVRFDLPGYEGESIEVTLFESPEALDEPETGRLGQAQYWRHSLLVASGRAAYEFWPGGSYTSPPESSYFRRLFGSVDVPLINRLLIESDILSGGEEVVSRNRHGLARGTDHRFSAALDDALDEALRPHIERMRQEALATNADQTTTKTQRMLNQLASVLNDYVREETETEHEGPGTEADETLRGLRLIPPTRHVEPLLPAHLLIRYEPVDDVAREPLVEVTVSDDLSVPSTEPLQLIRRRGYFSASYRLEGRPADSVVELTAELADEQAEALVLWQERI